MALESFKPGTLIAYKKEKIVKTRLPDGSFQITRGRGLAIPKGKIAMVVKEPYDHETGRLVCLQILYGEKLYEDRYLSAVDLLKNIKVAKDTI